ncbi:MAG: lysylphosphatidylglycerol synthase transmembrane domain-containing protein [Thermodesulfobacteriota bacterium]
MGQQKLSIKHVLCIFLAVSLSVLGLLAVLTMGPKTLEEIRQIQVADFFVALGLAQLSLILDGMTLRLIAEAAGTDVGLAYSVKSILFYLFLSTITPTVTGGEPLLLYQLTRKKMSAGRATSVIFLRGAMILSLIAGATPAIVFFHGELIENALIKYLLHSIGVFLSLLLCSAGLLSLFPQKGEKMISAWGSWLDRFPAAARYGRRLEEMMINWLHDFHVSLKTVFLASKARLLSAFICCALSLLANFLIASAILHGLNCQVPVPQVLMVQFVLYFLLYFTPTPGGSGIAEGGGYALFAALVPIHFLGVFVILWRFFTVYLWAFIGGILVVKTLGFDMLERISAAEGEPSMRDSSQN